MTNCDVLLIDPHVRFYENKVLEYGNLHSNKAVNCKMFNPGVLSIGSYLDWKGFAVKVLNIISEEDISKKIDDFSREYASPKIIGISCSYMHTYENTLIIAEILKKRFPLAIIVVGGMHISSIPHYALKECPAIDIVIRGEGEFAFEKLVKMVNGEQSLREIGNIIVRKSFALLYTNDLRNFSPWEYKDFVSENELKTFKLNDVIVSKSFEKLADLNELPFVKYDLYEDYLSYPPYLEESRGCYGKCHYCVSSIKNTYREKKADRFLEELEYLISIFGNKNMIAFTSANFGVNPKNTIDICQGIIDRGLDISWEAEFRVDLQWEKYIDLMYKAGCKGFAVGLESSNKQILRLMNKTNNPEIYLKKTRELIEYVRNFKDSYIHLNLMFYAGESPQSLAENMLFLGKYFPCIESMHYSPLIIYPETLAWNNFIELNKEFGTSIVKNDIYDRLHAYPVNPSNLYSYHEACIFSRIVEKMFVEKDGYAALHETRLSRNDDGDVDAYMLDAFIKEMKES